MGSPVGAVGSKAVPGFGVSRVSTLHAPEGVETLLSPMRVVEAARGEQGDDAAVRWVCSVALEWLGLVQLWQSRCEIVICLLSKPR